jgi:NAD(P)-dependent dehydrogenase (short-subunit alcohol dehydrogenase family)
MASELSSGERPVAIVTAASHGIGEGIAREFSARGYRLVIMSRSSAITDLANELAALALQGSVAEAADLERLVRMAHEKFGRIDAVINNTGHPATGDLLALSDADWHAAVDLVLLNVVRMSRLVTPLMLAAGRGAIVNISGVGAVQPDLRFPLSAVLRSGLGGFAKMFADRYAAQGLRMNNLLPGRIDSFAQPPERILEIPSKRAGTVKEIADVAAFLASDEARYINGQSLIVDGGLVRGA